MNEWELTDDELDAAWQAGFPEYRDKDVAHAAQVKMVKWLEGRNRGKEFFGKDGTALVIGTFDWQQLQKAMEGEGR
jgi:hypothetical protein